MVVVSDEKGHNSTTVVAILRKVIPRLQELVPQLSPVHYWTDSPTSQYRNKTMFSVVGEHAEIFEGIHAQWNYFEAGHGKGPCDGIGGTVKRMADNAVKRKIVIQDAHDFFAWATQEQGSTKTKIEYIFLTKEECVEGGLFIAEKWSTVKTFPGTLQVHAVIGQDKGVLIRNVSCYCTNCREVNPGETIQTKQMYDRWQLRRFVSVTSRATKKSEAPEKDNVGVQLANAEEPLNVPSTSTPT